MGGARRGRRDNCSARAGAVRLALLAALGLLPSGCGGKSTNEGAMPVTGGSGGFAAGSTVSNSAGEANVSLFGVAGEASG